MTSIEAWQSIALDNSIRLGAKEVFYVRLEYMLASQLGTATLPVTTELPHQVSSRSSLLIPRPLLLREEKGRRNLRISLASLQVSSDGAFGTKVKNDSIAKRMFYLPFSSPEEKSSGGEGGRGSNSNTLNFSLHLGHVEDLRCNSDRFRWCR